MGFGRVCEIEDFSCLFLADFFGLLSSTLLQCVSQPELLDIETTSEHFEDVDSSNDDVLEPVEEHDMKNAPVPDQDSSDRDEVGADEDQAAGWRSFVPGFL